MAFNPILSAEESMNYSPVTPSNTAFDAGLNVLAAYLRKKGNDKKASEQAAMLSQILSTQDPDQLALDVANIQDPRMQQLAYSQILSGRQNQQEKERLKQQRELEAQAAERKRQQELEDFKAKETYKQEEKARIKKEEEDRISTNRYNTFQRAVGDVALALDDVSTGPGKGWLPAVTEGQQTFDASIMAIGPVIKDLFKGKGEGAWTDRDQKDLMAMLPTRNMSKEVAKAQLLKIDQLVKAKLDMADKGEFVPLKDLIKEQEPEKSAPQTNQQIGRFTVKAL